MRKVSYLKGFRAITLMALVFISVLSAAPIAAAETPSCLQCPQIVIPLSENWKSYYCLATVRFSEARQLSNISKREIKLLEAVAMLERAADLAPGLEDSALQLPIARLYKELFAATGDVLYANAAVRCLDRAVKIYPENGTARSEREAWFKALGPLTLGEDSNV